MGIGAAIELDTDFSRAAIFHFSCDLHRASESVESRRGARESIRTPVAATGGLEFCLDAEVVMAEHEWVVQIDRFTLD